MQHHDNSSRYQRCNNLKRQEGKKCAMQSQLSGSNSDLKKKKKQHNKNSPKYKVNASKWHMKQLFKWNVLFLNGSMHWVSYSPLF